MTLESSLLMFAAIPSIKNTSAFVQANQDLNQQLCVACICGNLPKVEDLKRQIENINFVDPSIREILCNACEKIYQEIFDFLIEVAQVYNDNIEFYDDDLFLLHKALLMGQVNLAQILIEFGCDVNLDMRLIKGMTLLKIMEVGKK